MNADTLLGRLDRPRRCGPNSWRAPCPAHGGVNRNALAVRELDDGTVLVRCHAHGYGAAEIVAAVGLDLTDLFPPRAPDDHRRPPERRPWHAADILVATAHEVTVAAVVACDIARRGTATDDERTQLLEAAARLADAVEVIRG